MKASTDVPVILFTTAQEWADWLEEHHDSLQAVWLKLAKKGATISSITYDQALDEALCYGWIDSQAKSFDEQCYLQRFGPRRSKSPWSKINIGHIARLSKEGRMKPAGIKAVEEAIKDGRW
jgi:uncharacterized protein YdeI (YjbR/CyaY-like superfamily)